MTIIEALQNKDNLLRITCGWRWLCGDGEGGWVVYEHPYHAKKSKVVCQTEDESAAVRALLDDEESN